MADTLSESVRPVPGAGAHPRRWAILALLCIVQFMLLLDDTVVNVALPKIQQSLHFSLADLAWVVNAYVLVFGGFLLLGGRLADLFGRRRIFLVGTALFALASLTNGLAQSQGMLIASRAVQGLGGALAAPAALSMIAVLFTDGKERARALGFWGGLTALGGTTGVVLSGVLTDLVNWRWIFYINVPIALIPLLLIPRIAPESRRASQHGFDLLGAITVTGATSALVYGLLSTVSHGWGSTQTVTGLMLAGVLLVAFFVAESRVEHPLVPLSFFSRRRPATADFLQLLMASANFGTFFLLTLYLQQVMGYSPLRAGLSYAGFFVGIFAGFGTASPLVPKIGVRPFMVCGMLLLAGGMFWFSQVPQDAHYWSNIFPGFMLMAVGIAWCALTITIAGVSDVPESETGLASGMLNAAAQVGGAVGLAVLVTIASRRTVNLLGSGVGAKAAQVSGTHLAFFIGGMTLLVGAAVAAVFIGRLKPESLPPMVVVEDHADTEVRA
jgi:EmrB/QacA subfamily drug resistance transporter